MRRQLTIVIPLPPEPCSPNSRAGHFEKARAIKRYRGQAADEAGWARVQFGKELGFPWRKAHILARFFHPAKNRRDPDNMLASLKAAFDGLRDGRILSDDDQLTHLPPEFSIDPKRPRVELVIGYGEPWEATFWLCGQLESRGFSGMLWETIGVFRQQDTAEANCTTPLHFVAPMLLEKPLPSDLAQWEGLYFPREKAKATHDRG